MALTLKALFDKADAIINQLIGIVMILGTIAFLWGMIQYIMAAGDEKKIGEAKHIIVVGIIGLFMMTAVWGIVKAISKTFFG